MQLVVERVTTMSFRFHRSKQRPVSSEHLHGKPLWRLDRWLDRSLRSLSLFASISKLCLTRWITLTWSRWVRIGTSVHLRDILCRTTRLVSNTHSTSFNVEPQLNNNNTSRSSWWETINSGTRRLIFSYSRNFESRRSLYASDSHLINPGTFTRPLFAQYSSTKVDPTYVNKAMIASHRVSTHSAISTLILPPITIGFLSRSQQIR